MSMKKSRSKKAQIEMLVDFMATHNRLATGNFAGPLEARRAETQWQLLKNILKKYGPDRSIDQWKQTWKDLKKAARHDNVEENISSAPSTSNPAPTTSHPTRSTSYPTPSTNHPTLSTGHPTLSTRHPTLSTCHPTAQSKEHLDESFDHLRDNNEILQSIHEGLGKHNDLLREQNELLQAQNIILSQRNKLKRLKRFSRRF